MTYIIKMKCMRCSLHFTAYSWHDDWFPRVCPECGQTEGAFLVWRDESPAPIFEYVPGGAELAAFGVPKETS